MAEILCSSVGLYRDLGLQVDWAVLEGDDSFFAVTKGFHNALQGENRSFTDQELGDYLSTNQANARNLPSGYDVIFVHDPQPVALRNFVTSRSAKWVWRCHIDTSAPDMNAWRYVQNFVQGYDAAIFSMSDFMHPDLGGPEVRISAPGIDPLSQKNRPVKRDEAKRFVASYGIDPGRPLICQVSRFDPWKDPLGVIQVYQVLKPQFPGLQLAMAGNFAPDDPQGYEVYGQVMEAAEEDPDIHIIVGLTHEVRFFQKASDVVIQKSLREGFALTVSEALWKGTPVVGGDVGGIRIQLPDGVGGYRADSAHRCVDRVAYLLEHPEAARRLGELGREHVRRNFLVTRLMADELGLIAHLVAEGAPEKSPGLEPGQKLVGALGLSS